MPGSFDFLHIKRRTAGSSNELSFDVLDHKSAQADDQKRRLSRRQPPADVPKSGFHVMASQSTSVISEEVAARKKERRAQRIHVRTIAAVAVAVLACAGIYAGFRFHQASVDYSAMVGNLVEELTEVDETLVEVDALMRDPLDPAADEARTEAASKMPSLETKLNRISTNAQTMLEHPIDERTAVVVGEVDETARARSSMLAAARDAFRLSSECSQQVERANRAWNDVVNADQLAREAISFSNKATTPESTSEALERIRNALAEFRTAEEEMAAIASAYDVDFAAQQAYLSKKIEALESAVSTSEALLAANREAALAANEDYGLADAQAAQLASELPTSVGDTVRQAFEGAVAQPAKCYAQAREQAVEADSVIRSYLAP